jgi:CheY-like chemotaxis protein
VQLPTTQQMASNASETIQAQSGVEAPLAGIQILLVDDEPDTREFQAFLLEQRGAAATAVASGFEALQSLEQFIPDVLVSDIGMAEIDGYMLLLQIRDREASRSNSFNPIGAIPAFSKAVLPAIALTAYATEVDQQRALQVGFQTHLTKPVEPEELVRAIASVLKRN